MTSSPDAPHPEYRIRRAANGRVWIIYKGPTSAEGMKSSLDEASRIMPPADAELVFDVRGVPVQNPETRSPVVDWLKRERKRVKSVDVIFEEGSAVMKMTAAAVGLAVGIRLRIHEGTSALE